MKVSTMICFHNVLASKPPGSRSTREPNDDVPSQAGSSISWPRAVVALLCTLTTQANAAGGHHAVDDAAILEAGQCQVETWADRYAGGARTLVHFGPACHVGGVELGVSLDRLRSSEEGNLVGKGVQIKWAGSLSKSVSLGVVLAANWQNTSPGFTGTTLVVPVTWQAGEKWLAHINLGRDFRRAGADSTRSGVALEWAPQPKFSVVAERFREGGGDFWRAGGRWAPNAALSIDISHARGLHGAAPPWWTVGLTWVFER